MLIVFIFIMSLPIAATAMAAYSFKKEEEEKKKRRACEEESRRGAAVEIRTTERRERYRSIDD